MREIHAKGVKFTRFAIAQKCDHAGFQAKTTLASTLLKILLNDVDSVDGQQ
jgi:hypothetical protein